MTIQPLGRDTTSVDGLVWNGRGFGDATADAMWAQLADSLKQIALAELQAGNAPIHILFNETRGIVLLSFAAPPMTPRPSGDEVRIHTSFAHGNYCYDGTLCTYEDNRTGCFLAFDEP
jgi:hypothetical protein